MFLATHVFTHGQLYTGFGRVQTPRAIRVYVPPQQKIRDLDLNTRHNTLKTYTKNITLKQILAHIP